MASRSERIKLLAQAIGADIKSILAKTNLLKTAAYKDVGTTDGTIPQYVGANGVGGLGYGGLVTNLPASTDLDDLRYITANYSGIAKPVNFPAGSNLIGAYSLSVVAGDYGVKQTLTVAVYDSPEYGIAIYERINVDRWSDWRKVAMAGEGSPATVLSAGADLNTLPKDNGLYSGDKNTAVIGMPDEMAGYIFDYSFLLETLTDVANASYVQKLYINAFPPSGTDKTNTVTYIRSHNYLGLSEWQRLAGKMYGIDVVGDVIGDDLVVNSIKAGATSPKIAFEIIRLDITYANFGYQSDGVTGIDGMNRGLTNISSSVPLVNILSISSKLYADFGGYHAVIPYEATGSGRYVKVIEQTTGGLYLIKTTAHLEETGGDTNHNAEKLFNNGSYIELFVTYKVD